MRTALIVSLTLLASTPAAVLAQVQAPSSSTVLTLDDALAQARAQSPATEAANAGIRVADAQRDVARQRPNPEVEATSEYFGGSGAYRGFSSAENTVRLALPLELGGKRTARIGVADAQIGRARIGSAIALADLTLAVTQGYNEAVTAERRLSVARDQATVAAEASRAAGVRVASGVASPLEQQRADVLRTNAQTAVERAARTVDVARANLARLIGQPVSGRLDEAWFDRLDGLGPASSVAAEGTLALAAASADTKTASAQVRLAKSQRIPDVRVSAGVRRLDATDNLVGVVGVSLPIPFFNNGSAALAQARAQEAQAAAQRQVALIEAERSIASARADLDNAAATARNATGPALAAAQEGARIARIGYREGKFGQLDLLEAERSLAETKATAIDALAAYHDARARLERLTAPAFDPTKDAR